MTLDEYKNYALNEYPRLCKELAEMTKKISNEIGAQYNESPGTENLNCTWDNQPISLGPVKRPTWTVSKNSKKINFKPNGLSTGTIAGIKLTSPNSKIDLFRESYHMVEAQGGGSLILATMSDAHSGAKKLEYDNLKNDIERFLK